MPNSRGRGVCAPTLDGRDRGVMKKRPPTPPDVFSGGTLAHIRFGQDCIFERLVPY